MFIPDNHILFSDLGNDHELGEILKLRQKPTAAICRGPFARLSTKHHRVNELRAKGVTESLNGLMLKISPRRLQYAVWRSEVARWWRARRYAIDDAKWIEGVYTSTGGDHRGSRARSGERRNSDGSRCASERDFHRHGEFKMG